MTPETAQKLWDVYCGELIDNGDKTSEDVRQALATFLRKIVSDYDEYADDMYGKGITVVTSDTLLNIAYSLENLK